MSISINYNVDKYTKPRKKIIIILKVVILVFYLTLFPLKIWNMIFMLFGHQRSFRSVIRLREYWYINIIMRNFFYMNSSINPILFNALSTKFRNGCRNLFDRTRFSFRKNSMEMHRKDEIFRKDSSELKI